MSESKQTEITLTVPFMKTTVELTYTVNYTVYPPSRGSIELGSGIPLTPDEPGRIEIDGVRIEQNDELRSVVVTDEIEGMLYEILYRNEYQNAYSELNQYI